MSENGSKAVTISAGKKAQGIVPTNMDEAARIAKMAVMGGIFGRPRDEKEEKESIAKATLCILFGLELGISPMNALTGIALINAKPVIYGALIPALVRRAGHKLKEWFEGEDDNLVAKGLLTREDGEEIEYEYSVKDARKAALWGKSGVWSQHPKRMLRMRCRGFLVRDGAPEVLLGMTTAEEMQDVAEEHRGEIRAVPDIPPPPPELEDDRAFLQEATEVPTEAEGNQDQLDIETALENADIVGKALADFQCKATNAETEGEVLAAFEEFEAETDGICSADFEHSAKLSFEMHMERVRP